jgi:hypothetical protein
MTVLTADDFREIVRRLGQVALDDIAWSDACREPQNAIDFASEAIFVICNSGMKNTIARSIYERVERALHDGHSAGTVFGHKGKAAAIDDIWKRQDELLAAYLAAPDKVEFCASLPWIGGITKYHLAKNFGADVAKPDVHLQRLADLEGVTAQKLCARLSRETGHRIATVDVVLWRACANGVLNSRTGELARQREFTG